MLAQDSDRDRARSPDKDPKGHVSDEPTRQRKILHIDMDAFYASVEQRDNPELRGNPIAVGGSRERGVVAAASYEARAFGVRSAMPSVTAKRKCPDLIFVKPRFDVYKVVSLQIRAIFAAYTPIIEPLSLDEAYLDVTENLKGIVSATQIAETIREKIRTETGLTASAGVSYNKFLAKLASDYRKPDGLFVITPKMGPAFVERLSFCIEALEEALARHGRPEIFNTDQGSQFTSAAFTDVLLKAGVAISMDGKGSWRDKSSSSGFGDPSNTRRCISEPTRQ